MERVVLGLGSNKGFSGMAPDELLKRACARISEFVCKMEFSSIYRTAAMYVLDQDDFYNMVAVGEFSGTPELLLEKIHSVEQEFGRNRISEIRNGPRSLDIDIELFGHRRINTQSLVVPHERLLERAFVLVPFLEVLEKNADVNKADIEFYGKKLELLENQRVEKYCPFY
ncbi:2-amino-4-hydroxy-6-hydroxymethyldihydropteridine diphosphokinase [Treponema sp.]|uniref:2-amino-4-hydroxy-6- hydroxymethyldihydropteridine diphosphokinase n=1 Tax=Treponema sp. TaxID=166 RepID=UPI003F0C3715